MTTVRRPPSTIDALLPRCRFPAAGTEVTSAVSGGADSLALLVLAVAAGARVTAVHVDHGLRAGSGDEADVVADAAERFGAAFRAVRVQVAPGPNLEARARAARYAALPADVLTGHTADDQAETVLLNLLRGAGLDGLAGMRSARRPLLGLRRSETRALCADLGLRPVEDPSNDVAGVPPQPGAPRAPSPARRHRRARRRHGPRPPGRGAPRRGRPRGRRSRPPSTPPTPRALAAAPVALARRAVRRWLAGEHPPDGAAVERVLAVARGERRACEVAPGLRVERHQQRLRLVPGPVAGPTPG